MRLYFILLCEIVFATAANLLIKRSAQGLQLSRELFFNSYLVMGLFSYGAAFALWLLILSKIKLSIAYPISVSLTFSFIVISSRLLFEEQLSTLQILGIVIIIVGIFLLLYPR